MKMMLTLWPCHDNDATLWPHHDNDALMSGKDSR